MAIHPGQRSIDQADLVAATAQSRGRQRSVSWPPAFSSLAVSVQVLMAADTLPPHRAATQLLEPSKAAWRTLARGPPR